MYPLRRRRTALLAPYVFALLLLATRVSAEVPGCPPPGELETSNAYCFANGYFLVAGAQGILDELRFDPTGEGAYGPNLIVSMRVQGSRPSDVAWRIDGDRLSISGIGVTTQLQIEGAQPYVPVERADRLLPGSTLGQSFVADVPFNKVGGSFPTWGSATSAMTLTLKRDGPDGPVVTSRRFTDLVDNAWVYMEFDAQQPGTYYLEISEPSGTVGWWTAARDTYPQGQAFHNGRPDPTADRTLNFTFLRDLVRTGTWHIQLDGDEMILRFAPNPREPGGQFGAGFEMVTPWEKSGYDVTNPATTPFLVFQNSRGRYQPIEAYKRIDSWEFDGPPIYATGQNGYDLEFGGDITKIEWSMDEDAMTWRFVPTGSVVDRLRIKVHEPTGRIPEYFPVFYSSDPEFDALLNRFYYERAYSYAGGSFAGWMEWTGLIHAWVAHPHREALRQALLTNGQDPDGYVWSYGPHRGWPFPEPAIYDTRHFTTNASFILGAYRYYTWTKDQGFLRAILPKLRLAMRFQLEELGGKDGLVVLPGPHHSGRKGDLGSNYWDILPFGHLSAYENIYFYASLRAMAEFERAVGNAQEAERLLALSERTRVLYNQTFWDDEVGRYIGAVDIDGVRHDYGFTFLNMEAMAYGLAEPWQAERIYHWMEHEPTSAGTADTYTKWIFAPRTTTIHNDGWFYPGWPGTPFGDQVQDGGAVLYTSFYDVMARRELLGTENAWQRFVAVLERYALPDKLAGGSPLYFGEIPQRELPGQVGTDEPFPESALVPSAVLYAFIGARATVDGLWVDPHVPEHFEFLGVRNVSYRGWSLDIRVSDSIVQVEGRRGDEAFRVDWALDVERPFLLEQAVPDIDM